MKRSHFLLLALFNVFWSGIMSVNKELEPSLSVTSLVTLRFGLAALGFALVWRWLPGPSPDQGVWIRASLMGVTVFVLGQRLQVYGNFLGTAGNSSVLMGFEPVLTSVAAAWFLRERIPWTRWGGFALCLLGLAFLNQAWGADFRWSGLWASAIFVSSFLCESVYSILGKPLGARASPYRVTAIGLIAATVVNLLIDGGRTVSEAARLGPYQWALLSYLAFLCTMAGYVLWLVILQDTEVNLVALTVFVQPVAGVMIAAFWLHESTHWGQLWGTLAIGAGLLVGFLAERRDR
ncbi:MAG: DMT family transporter [Verrucomicrobia bacterium]|nr:DMT family transporter [Verrucomicrobiota bacterium]MBI3869418.1 DMT family transporter [Verrucomicrobiota bacterium]